MTNSGNRSASGVSYSRAEEGYFEKRSLKRTAGVAGLWGLGIAAVISADSGVSDQEVHDALLAAKPLTEVEAEAPLETVH